MFIIADSFNLELSVPTNQVPTRYSDNSQEADSVIDLMFLRFSLNEINNHSIRLNWRLTSDYALLTVIVPIIKEHVQTKKHTTIKDSNKEHTFIKEIIKSIKNINTADISNIAHLDSIVNEFASSLESI